MLTVISLDSTIDPVDSIRYCEDGRCDHGVRCGKDRQLSHRRSINVDGSQRRSRDLKTDLTCIQGYLKDVEAREREDKVSKEWTKLVLDIAYDIEDVLDTYLMKAEQRSQRELLIGDAVNLQTLRSISSYSWSKLKHESLINLRDLEIYDNHKNSRSVPVCLASFTELRNLRVLTLETTAVIKLFLESETAVRSMDVISPTLESVTLVRVNLEIDTMSCLQKLPRLEDLILDCDYEGENISISAQGFGRLRRLQLDIKSLDVLQIEEEAMPSLIQLILNSRGQQTKLIIPKRVREFIQII